MEAINFISGWANWLIIIIPVLTTLVVSYHALGMICGEEDKFAESKQKIVSTLKGAVVVWGIDAFIVLIKTFYV